MVEIAVKLVQLRIALAGGSEDPICAADSVEARSIVRRAPG